MRQTCNTVSLTNSTFFLQISALRLLPPLPMRPPTFSRGILILLLVLATATATRASSPKSTFIVYMAPASSLSAASSSASDRYTTALLHAQLASGDSSPAVAAADSPSVELTYTYDVFDAFAAPMSSLTAEALRENPEVLAVVPDGSVDPETTHTPSFLGLEKGLLWRQSRRGADGIVGVIDTGAWPESASFADAGVGAVPAKWKGGCQVGEKWTTANCNRKLVGARFFYKGHMAAEGVNRTNQVLSARDTQGHGSHTASTAAGAPVQFANMNGLGQGSPARGVAEQARVAVYKVCWRTCYDSDALAAYDAAVKDGVDVISVSLGGPARDYILDSNAVGSFGAIKAGIFVANSGGNRGGKPSTVSNGAPWVMTVAASTVDRDFFADVQLGNGKKYRGKSWTPGNWGSFQYPLIRGVSAKLASAASAVADNCKAGSLNPTLLRGKIVICQNQDGFNLPVEKAQAVLAAGARGLIVIDVDDTPQPNHYVLPTVVVGATVGQSILAYVASTTKPTAVLYPETVLGVKPAPVVASFSSRGPSAVNPKVLKPDVTAPGVNILAAWTEYIAPTNVAKDPNRIKFKIISGTSMATPHVAGLGALLKASYPRWSPASIKSALMTSATVVDNRGGRLTDQWTLGGPATPFDYGAGHVVPEKARTPGLLYDISVLDYVNFLCAFGYTAKQVQVFYGTPVTCPKIPVRSEDFNYPTFSATFAQSLRPVVVRFTRTVTNVGPSNAAYTAVIKAPTGVKIVVSPTILRFTKDVSRRSFTLTVTTIGAPKTAFGSLTWTAPGGIYVQSPIVITPAVVKT